MPAWAAKFALRFAKDPEKGIKWLFTVMLGFLAFLLILTAPFILLFMPFAEKEQYDYYKQAANQMSEESGLFVDYREIMALDAVIREQDFDGVTKNKIYKYFYELFIYEKKVEVQVQCPVTETKEPDEDNSSSSSSTTTSTEVCTEIQTILVLRSLSEVMDLLDFNEEQRELAYNYLASSWEDDEGGGGVGSGSISPEVYRYEPLIREEAIKNGVEKYMPYILALIQQESGGRSLDIMQASESLGLPPNTITDPEYSIQVGVKYFAERLKQSNGDIKLALQSYNFGGGFIDYANSRGGYSKEVAVAYSDKMAAQKGWDRYGDVNYVDNVLRYLVSSEGQAFDVNEVLSIMKGFSHLPYVWGGRNPSDGGFDCSGLIEYAFAKVGVNISGTAATQYSKTKRIEEKSISAGDLVFFNTEEKKETDPDYNPNRVTHVGMYTGNGQFFNAQGTGIKSASLDYWRKNYILLGFGRIQ